MDQNQLNLNLNPEVAKGTYANLAVISHSATEFIVDFAQMMPGLPKPEVVSRVIMVPQHAKRLLMALGDNVSKYEAKFGPIDMEGGPQGTLNLADLNLSNGAKS